MALAVLRFEESSGASGAIMLSVWLGLQLRVGRSFQVPRGIFSRRDVRGIL